MKPTKKPGGRARGPLSVVGKQDHEALQAGFAEHAQLLLPMLELIQNTRISVDELMYDAGRALASYYADPDYWARMLQAAADEKDEEP